MSQWICCNSCFKSLGPDRQLAVTNCGHIICSVCFQKGKQGECLICKAKCQLSQISDKSSSEVKALFSDINTIAAKYLSEISKFQARHQKRLIDHYQQKNEKMNEAVIKMQQEMQQMSKTIAEQNTYISKLKSALQHQRLGSQVNREMHKSADLKPVTKIVYSSPVSLSRHSSSTSLMEGMEDSSRVCSHKPEISGSIPRLCLISAPQDGRMGNRPQRTASQSTMGSHSVQSASVSREFSSSLKDPTLASSSNMPFCRESPWGTPIFKMPPAYKFPSMSSLGPSP